MNVETLLYGGEPDFLQRVCRNKTVLEIGAYKGGSTRLIAAVAKWVMSIDTFMSDNIPGTKGENTLNQYLNNTGGFPNISYIIGNSKTVNVAWEYDILFIDGDHSYEGCLNDLTRFTPKEGYLVHDYGSPLFVGIMAACINFFKCWPHIRVDSLAYWKKDK